MQSCRPTLESSGLTSEEDNSWSLIVFHVSAKFLLLQIQTVTLKLLSVPPNKGTIKLFKKRHNVKLDQVLSELLKDGISVSLIPWHAINEGCM